MDTSPSGRVVWERAANRIMSCVFTFTQQTEGQDRYVTNVIREGYHPSSSAFNETPLTMWLCSSSTRLQFFSTPSLTLTLGAQYVLEMGYAWYHPMYLNLKIWIHTGADRRIIHITNRSEFLSVTIHCDPGAFSFTYSPGTVGSMSWEYLIKIEENGSAVSIVPSNSLVIYSFPHLANVTAFQIPSLSIFAFSGKESLIFPQVNEIVTAPYEIASV